MEKSLLSLFPVTSQFLGFITGWLSTFFLLPDSENDMVNQFDILMYSKRNHGVYICSRIHLKPTYFSSYQIGAFPLKMSSQIRNSRFQ